MASRRGIGRETLPVVPENCSQTKNLLVSYRPEADGLR